MRIDLKLQEGESGSWSLKKFQVSRDEALIHGMRCAIGGYAGRAILPGEYWVLKNDGEIVMSNTPAEVADHINFINKASGSVLIAGLGLGMVLQEILKKKDVTKVTVVEISKDVINLVSKFYNDPRLEIVNCDIHDFIPNCKYDYGWYDIWNTICSDNYDEMKKITAHLKRWVKKSDCWCKKEVKRLYEQDKKYDKWYYGY